MIQLYHQQSKNKILGERQGFEEIEEKQPNIEAYSKALEKPVNRILGSKTTGLKLPSTRNMIKKRFSTADRPKKNEGKELFANNRNSNITPKITESFKNLVKKKQTPDTDEKLEYKSQNDFDFLKSSAPYIMKKLLYKTNNWDIYDEKKVNRYQLAPKKNIKKSSISKQIDKKFNQLLKDTAFKVSFTTEKLQNWLKQCLTFRISDSD